MDQDRSLFIVVSGSFEVFIPSAEGHSKIADIDIGSVFGELSFLDGEPRLANVRALTDSEIIKLTHEKFEEMAAKEPKLTHIFLLELGRVLSLRLRIAMRTSNF